MNISQASSGIEEVKANVSRNSTAVDGIARDICEVNRFTGEMAERSAMVRSSANTLTEPSASLGVMVCRFKV